MMKRVGVWLFVCLMFCSSVFAQSDAGKIKGKVTDETGAPVELATVVILQNGIIKGGANTDENGDFSIAPVEPGVYEVKTSYAGNTALASGIKVGSNKTVKADLVIETGVELSVVEITESIPIDNTTTGGSLTGSDIQQIGIRNINTLAAIIPGVYQSDDGGGLSMRGGRSSSTVYFVDGVKVRGNLNLPQKAIGNLTVITGGTPAEFGDVTGGIVSVTTASPSYQLNGGGEILTSQFLDPYGFNLAAVNFSGPIITKRVDSIDYNKPILGFFIAGEFEHQKDRDPANGGVFRLTDAAYDDYRANPLTVVNTGGRDFFQGRANYVTPDQVIKSKYKENNTSRNIRVNGRLDFQPTDNIIVKLGGDFSDVKTDQWSNLNSMFSRERNRLFTSRQIRTWLRFQQSFDEVEGSEVKNLFYQLQADFTRFDREFMSAKHQDRIFDYGYIGKFDYDRQETFRYVDPIGNPDDHQHQVSSDGYFITNGFSQTNLSFDPSNSKNPELANYTSFIMDYIKDNPIINPFTGRADNNLDFLRSLGGLRNGDAPGRIYSLYTAPGENQRGYNKTRYDQFRISGQASGEIKGHALKVGFEFEQRQERSYGVNSRFLWNYIRQLTNRHLSGINQDINSWELVNVNGVFQDSVHAPNLFVGSDQSDFDRALREKLGLPVDGTDFIITDNLDPSIFSLDMFSADELLNDGNQLVSYYGYDFTGNPTKPVAEGNFFTDTKNRPMNAFAPTYISGFIQDKFELEDIIFNIGVRVDRFDANQKVLKDSYVLFPTYSASEASELLSYDLPSNVPGNWVPYMDDATNPTTTLGYRDPQTNFWYDANGVPTSSASLRSGGEVQPYLKDDEISINSFEDYTPQTVVMPRLSFSFPISGEAVFFAHYDVLTQRPGQNSSSSGSLLAGRLADYYFLQNSATIQVTNPNLAPEKTIDYEVGFKQKLNNYVALSVSTFYREMRDMLQTTNFQDAYPTTYTSFSNIDYGTVKGFTFSLNMIRYNNLRMSASYTLQFAAGTGSDFSSARNALNAVDGFTAIRALLPLDFDQRHRLSGNVDYRFYGEKNKGPAINLGSKTIYPLSNAGANMTFYLGSGTPYSVNSLANPADVQTGVNQQIQLDGTPNGSRLPWQVRFDLRIDKDLVFGGKQKLDSEGNMMKDGKGNNVTSKRYSVNVYIQMLNALNTRNILNIYKTSGLPDDDGYLSTGVGQQAVAAAIDADAFTYLYMLKAMNPNNYSLPRRIRLGLQFSF